MNDRTIPAGDNTPAKQPAKQRPQVGDYLMKIEEVPKEVRDYAVNKLSPKDADGNRLKDDAGKEVRAGIAAAKENGSYYGPVVLNNDKFIVQAVGKDRSYAVVHPKDKVELQGSTLAMLDAKKQLNGFNVQIHYTGDKAKAYPFKPKEATADQAQGQQRDQAPKAKEAKETMKPEALLAQAQEYAAGNIKNANQRAAFLKHMEAVTKQAFEPREQAAQQAAKPAPTKAQPAKQADKGIER
ncbi:hypothetical protein V3X37_004492 [Salmonella enterica]